MKKHLILFVFTGLNFVLGGAQAQETDTLFYYLNDGRISVSLSPWENGRRNIDIYDMHGNVSMTLEEARLSFQVYHELVFRENGSLEKVISSMNPGASRYYYRSEISFTGINEPSWKVEEALPAEGLDYRKKFFWSKKKQDWVQQEVISCDPPRDSLR
jgi:hypothetical protein